MNWDAIGTIAELLGAVGVIVTLVFIALQLRQQIIRSNSEAYYSAVSLMIDKWESMNKVLSDEFHPYVQWRPEDRALADEVCLILHQLGAAVERSAVPIEITDVYFYTIPTIHRKLKEHIEDRRDPESEHYRSNKYFWAFDTLAEAVHQRNQEAERHIRGDV